MHYAVSDVVLSARSTHLIPVLISSIENIVYRQNDCQHFYKMRLNVSRHCLINYLEQ